MPHKYYLKTRVLNITYKKNKRFIKTHDSSQQISKIINVGRKIRASKRLKALLRSVYKWLKMFFKKSFCPRSLVKVLVNHKKKTLESTASVFRTQKYVL